MSGKVQIDTLLNQVAYRDRSRVKDNLQGVLNVVRTLHPKVGSLTHNNGTSSKVVLLAGTIPIYYQSATYNIPIELFIMEGYPNVPPKLYVRPTSNMTIKANHRHVDMQGLVYLPYLHEWKPHDSLVTLVEVASGIFSIDPPLFSKPAGAVYQSTVQAGSLASQTTGQQASANNTSNAYNIPAATLYSTNGNVISTAIPPPAPSQTIASQAQADGWGGAMSSSSLAKSNIGVGVTAKSTKQALIEEVSIALQQEMMVTQSVLKNDINKEFNNEQYLADSQDTVKARVEDAKVQIEQYNEAIEYMDKKIAEMEEWETQQRTLPPEDVEDKILVSDELSAQILRLYAELNAIEVYG
jgi:ESCRT-I complex subunit TSG101